MMRLHFPGHSLQGPLFGAHAWRNFWEGQVRPLHRSDNEEHYRAYARELAMLIGDSNKRAVLELGCGNGALFRNLHFEASARYRGVDFSESMLQSFRAAHSGVDLISTDAAAYLDDRRYELIFSNALVPYLAPKALRRHITNAKRMLEPGGRIVCASVPWRALRSRYFAGDFVQSTSTGRIRKAMRSTLGPFTSRIGNWYELAEFIDIANRTLMNVYFHGSFHYPYRFHAVFTHNPDQSKVDR